jgi:hypothetical protein
MLTGSGLSITALDYKITSLASERTINNTLLLQQNMLPVHEKEVTDCINNITCEKSKNTLKLSSP